MAVLKPYGRKPFARARHLLCATGPVLCLASLIQIQLAVFVPAHAQIVNTVTANGFEGGVPVSSSSTVSVDVEDAAPAMVASQTATLNDDDGTPGLSAGDTVTFTITLENTGNITLESVIPVSGLTVDTVPASYAAPPALTGGDTANPGQLDPGETWSFEATYTVTQPDIDAGATIASSVDLTATARSGGALNEPTLADVTVSGAPSLALALSTPATGFNAAGKTVNWTIDVTNTGQVSLSSATVTLSGGEPVACPPSGTELIATLAPGAMVQCTASSQINAADVQAGAHERIADITATAPDTSIVTASDAVTLGGSGIDLVTVKQVAEPAGPAVPGDVVVFTIEVTNRGTGTATGVTLNDTLPATLTALPTNGTATAGAYDAATGNWQIGTLASGQAAVLTLTGTVNAASPYAEIENTTAEATADQPDGNLAGDVLTATVLPDLTRLVAVDDVLADPVDSATAQPDVINVRTNDTIGGLPATSLTTRVFQSGTWPTGITLEDDGTIDIVQYIAPGTYRLDYRLCAAADPANCADATATIEVQRTVPRLAGTVYLDNNGNRSLETTSEPTLAGYTIQLRDQNDNIVQQTVSDATGAYAFSGFEPGAYEIVIIDPQGRGAGSSRTGTIGFEQVINDADEPIDPSGVLYDSITGQPLAGLRVDLVSGATGRALPAACLLPNQAGQVSRDDGSYRFDIRPGRTADCPAAVTTYTLAIDEPDGYRPVPSLNVPPRSGALDPSTCGGGRLVGGLCMMSQSP